MKGTPHWALAQTDAKRALLLTLRSHHAPRLPRRRFFQSPEMKAEEAYDMHRFAAAGSGD